MIMRIRDFYLLFPVLFLSIQTAGAQNVNSGPADIPTEISVQSWKKGPGLINEREIHVLLTPLHPTYRTTISGQAGMKYELVFSHNSYGGLNEHWAVELYAVPTGKKKTVIG